MGTGPALLESGTSVRGVAPGLMEVMLGTYSRISPGSSGSGPQGSCSLQDSLPSSLEMKSMPSRCSLQYELGHISQNDAASLPQTSHWCQGHSHRPGDKKEIHLGKLLKLIKLF